MSTIPWLIKSFKFTFTKIQGFDDVFNDKKQVVFDTTLSKLEGWA